MKDLVARVDDALIDRVFQPSIDWLSDHMPVGIFRAARLCVDLASLMWICAQAGGLGDAARSGNPGFVIFRFVIIVLGLWAFSVLRELFRRTDSARLNGGQQNPLRAGMHMHRAACLFWMIALLLRTAEMPTGFTTLALLAVGVFATSAVYVGACTNYPPKRRESRADVWDLSRASI